MVLDKKNELSSEVNIHRKAAWLGSMGPKPNYTNTKKKSGKHRGTMERALNDIQATHLP